MGNRLFVPVYKACYVTLIIVNLFMLYDYEGFKEHTTWKISIIFLLLNLLSWILFSQRRRVGQIFEQALSLGRIVVLLLAVFIFFADIIGLYSPVGLVLWMSLLRLMQGLAAWRFFAWWSVCAILLALEFSFFRTVSEPLPE
jgi:hypothetical protein